MGNSSSLITTSTTTNNNINSSSVHGGDATAPSPRRTRQQHDDDDDHGCATAGAGAEDPSSEKVDQVFRVMLEAFHNAMAGVEMKNIDKGLMLHKLLTNLQEQYPSILPAGVLAAATATATAATTTANNDRAALDLTSFPAHKKQKTSSEGLHQQQQQQQEQDHVVQEHQHAIIYARNTLQGQPLEVLARVAKFLARSDINNYGATCKRIHNVVLDPNWVDLPWPLSCPFQVQPVSEFNTPPQVFFSDDKSRAAVYREGNYDEEDPDDLTRTVEVWDRYTGLLGKVDVYPCFYANPVFSPNNELLILSQHTSTGNEGIKVCQLPKMGLKAPIAVSSHQLHGNRVGSFTFLDNGTLCYIERSVGKLKRCKIMFDAQLCITCQMGYCNQINFSEPEHIFTNTWASYGLTAFSGRKGNLLVGVDGHSLVRIHDLQSKVSFSRRVPSSFIYDVSFSPDGLHLVVAQEEFLTVFDCSGERIQDIAEGKTIRFPSSAGFKYDHITWLPAPGSKIAVACVPTDRGDFWVASHVSIIDIEKEELLCDGWDASSWGIMVS